MAENKPLRFLQDLVLGGTSGVIAKTTCAPLERVKILLQVGSLNAEGEKYKGMVDALFKVPKEQGVVALWRGNLSNCLRYFPTQAMNFAFKERYQKLFVRPREEVGFSRWFLGYLAAGGAAGAGGGSGEQGDEKVFAEGRSVQGGSDSDKLQLQ
mmetsp:Transcript_19856/g.45279  ORF Transcript_19856/g.45279 Transcript_19856/m.45279 type:complete len:154 (-) Transcript_19856:179-640(-)